VFLGSFVLIAARQGSAFCGSPARAQVESRHLSWLKPPQH
jgi:hypothetical protein